MIKKTLGEREVISIHEDILKESSGLAGLRKDSSLESALHRIDDYVFYDDVTDIFEIAALYAIAIAQGHVFNDGNKRTAFVAMISFLSFNGYVLTAPFIEIENMMVDIAEKKIDRNKLTRWIKAHSHPAL